MEHDIKIYTPNKIINLTLEDSMEESDRLSLVLDNAGTEPLILNNGPCAK